MLAMNLSAFADELPLPPDESLLPLRVYNNEPSGNPEKIIAFRAEAAPLNIISSIIFLLAVVHVLFSRRILHYSEALEERASRLSKTSSEYKSAHFWAEIVHFFGEVEIIFGIWVIPLLLASTYLYGWQASIEYLNSRDYDEPVAVAVIMLIAASQPFIAPVEKLIGWLAHFFKNRAASYWLILMTLGPMAGSFVTEAGAMIMTGALLIKHFFSHPVSTRLAYATLGALFTNISLGGILTAFASPPALMVSKIWQWNSLYMLQIFGWKSALSILLTNLILLWYFRDEFKALAKSHAKSPPKPAKNIPLWVTAIHIIFLIGVVLNMTEPVIVAGLCFIFLGFYQASMPYQSPLPLKPALLVGFFIASLVILGGLQDWWIGPLLENASPHALLGITLSVAPFTDNAALAYLASFIPNLTLSHKYAVIVGAVCTAGTTVIGNAPNPAGYQLLSPHFPGGISAKNLLLGALLPALVSICIFLIFWP